MVPAPNLPSHKCWVWYQQRLCQESLGSLPPSALAGSQALTHSHTHPHTHPRTCSFTHALTLRSIFKLIALSALDFLTLISKSYICLSDIRHAWALFDLIHGSSLESPSVSNPMHQSAWPEPLDWPWCLAGLTPLHTQLGFH